MTLLLLMNHAVKKNTQIANNIDMVKSLDYNYNEFLMIVGYTFVYEKGTQ